MTGRTPNLEGLKAQLVDLAARWRAQEEARSQLIEERRNLVRLAKDEGLTRAEIADALDLTQPFVTRLLGATPTKEKTA